MGHEGKSLYKGVNALERLRAKTPMEYSQRLVNGARNRSRVKNIPFDLCQKYVLQLLKPMKCSCTGAELSFLNGIASPSLDRIDSKRGYTRDNVRIVSWWYNAAKNEYTDAETYAAAKAFVVHVEKLQNLALLGRS